MTLDKYCPVGPLDWQALIEFLGAGDSVVSQFGGRNRYHCSYVVYTDDAHYYAENGETGELDFGGPTSEGGVNGAQAGLVIQACVDAITEGLIFIREGLYTLNSTITLKSHIILEGEGMAGLGDTRGATTLYNAQTDGSHCITTNGVDGLTPVVGMQIKNLDIKGRGSSGHGIHLVYCIRNNIIEKCSIRLHHLDGVYTDHSYGLEVRDCWISRNDQHGVELTDRSHAVILDNCWLYQNYTSGLVCNESYQVKVLNTMSEHNNNYGFYFYKSHMPVIIGSAEQNGLENFYFDADAVYMGPTIIGGLWNTPGAGSPDIYIEHAKGGALVGVRSLLTTAPDYDFEFGANTQEIAVIGGSVESANTVNDLGTDNRFFNLVGYVTKNSGTATIAAANTSIAVAHGCNYTPAASDIDVILTNQPTADIGDVWLTNIGAANFTINCRNAPGVATAIFAWNVNGTR